MGRVFDTIGKDIIYPLIKDNNVFDKKKVLKEIDEIYEKEIEWIEAYTGKFLLKKYYNGMKTKYKLKISYNDFKKMFVFYKKRMELIDGLDKGLFMPLITVRFPKLNYIALTDVPIFYPNVEEEFLTSDFWYFIIDQTPSDLKNDITKYNEYYFFIMVLVDAIDTFNNRNTYKYLKDKTLESYIRIKYQNFSIGKDWRNYSSFKEYLKKNKEITLGISIERVINTQKK